MTSLNSCLASLYRGGLRAAVFLGRQTRPHDDTDILVRRDDQLQVQKYLVGLGWDLHKTQQPGLKPWPLGQFQNRPVNDIWCRRASGLPWALQIMLLDTDGDRWVFKRDPSIQGPINTLGLRTSAGVPHLRPEIQLLYKAKPETLAKDQADFDLTIPQLPRDAQEWLLGRLEKRLPQDHAWITSLRRETAPSVPGDA